MSPAESGGDAHLADVLIENEGGASVTEARVEVTAQLTDGSMETGHITFDFVPKGSTRTGVVRFSGEPRPDAVRLRTVSCIIP